MKMALKDTVLHRQHWRHRGCGGAKFGLSEAGVPIQTVKKVMRH
jgi:hypothetical protein